MEFKDNKPIVIDTSVLLNFVNIGRIGLLACLGTTVVLLDQVMAEVIRPDQIAQVEEAIAKETLVLRSVSDPDELSLFIHLVSAGRLGTGECAVLATAVTRDWIAGLQDKRARREGKRLRGDLTLWQTEDIVLDLICLGYLTIEEADGFLIEWKEKYRFRSHFSTFRNSEVPNTSGLKC